MYRLAATRREPVTKAAVVEEDVEVMIVLSSDAAVG
jgi:hypothetical protein